MWVIALILVVLWLPGLPRTASIWRQFRLQAWRQRSLAEFEAWLALAIAGRYHRQTHRALGISPLAAWEGAQTHQRRGARERPGELTFARNYVELRIPGEGLSPVKTFPWS